MFDPLDPVWSVNIMIAIGLLGVSVWIYSILQQSNEEMKK